MRTDFTINNEPYAVLSYGDIEIKIGTTLLHNLPGLLLAGKATEYNYWQELQDLSNTLKNIEGKMYVRS